MSVFFPGRTGFEMLLTQADHSGADKFRGGRDCKACHGGEERASGAAMIAQDPDGQPWIKSKPPALSVRVQTATADAGLFVRLTFDPGPQPNAAQDPEYETKVALMLGDGQVPELARGGCFAACHDDLPAMPSAVDPPLTKYLGASRAGLTRAGRGAVLPADQLSSLQQAGRTFEYWQARLVPGGSPRVTEGAVLDRRRERADPVVTAAASQAEGKWIVTFSRPLSAPGDRLNLTAGHKYVFGIAVHAGHTARRFHYVSLEQSLLIGPGNADFTAVGP